MIILMGVAGAGKSIQGRLFADKLGYRWISTGQLLRSLVTGERRQQMLAGKLLSDDEVIGLVELTLKRTDLSKQVVLDGFPRTEHQAEWLMQQINDGKLKLTAIFNLIATEEVVKQRLLSRGRRDDNEAVIIERFKEYETKTLPIIKFFKEAGITVYDIDADQDPETVYNAVISHISSETYIK